MTKPTEAAKVAALKIAPPQCKKSAAQIIQDAIDDVVVEKDAKNYKLIMENVSAANEICNWQSLCEKKDAEIERLEKELELRENLMIKHARHAGMDASKNSWMGCNNWLVGWIDQQLAEATNPTRAGIDLIPRTEKTELRERRRRV